MNLPSPIAKLRFKINVGQEEKHELKPRISAMCKISFELFAKSPSRKRTHELSVNKGFFFFFSSRVWKMSGFISVISYLQHFY